MSIWGELERNTYPADEEEGWDKAPESTEFLEPIKFDSISEARGWFVNWSKRHHNLLADGRIGAAFWITFAAPIGEDDPSGLYYTTDEEDLPPEGYYAYDPAKREVYWTPMAGQRPFYGPGLTFDYPRQPSANRWAPSRGARNPIITAVYKALGEPWHASPDRAGTLVDQIQVEKGVSFSPTTTYKPGLEALGPVYQYIVRVILDDRYVQRHYSSGFTADSFQLARFVNQAATELGLLQVVPWGNDGYLFTHAKPRRNPPRAVALERAQRSRRGRGAVGPRARVPAYVKATAKKGETILDFGAGVGAHAEDLRAAGLDVATFELGGDPRALRRKYQTVYASNVLNVQDRRDLVLEVLDLLAAAVAKGGRLVVNLPASPRYRGVPRKTGGAWLEAELLKRFEKLYRVAGTERAPVYEARGPRPRPGPRPAPPADFLKNPQGHLFGKPPPPGRVFRPGWTRISKTARKTGIHYRHDASGWEVAHCGHPTAIHPYFAIDPEHPDDVTVTHNGLGFGDLATAMEQVERVLAGVLVATGARCTPGTRRITWPADDREWTAKEIAEFEGKQHKRRSLTDEELDQLGWKRKNPSNPRHGRPAGNRLSELMHQGNLTNVLEELNLATFDEQLVALREYSWTLFAQTDATRDERIILELVFGEVYGQAVSDLPYVPYQYKLAAERGPRSFAHYLWEKWGLRRRNPVPVPGPAFEVPGDELGILYTGRAGTPKLVSQLPDLEKKQGKLRAFRFEPGTKVLYAAATRPAENTELAHHVLGFLRGVARAKDQLERFEKKQVEILKSKTAFVTGVRAYAELLGYDGVYWSPAGISVFTPKALVPVDLSALPEELHLADVAEISLDDPDADFWIARVHGDCGRAGRPTTYYRPSFFGVRIRPEWSHLFPARNLYQILDQLHRTGFTRQYVHGTAQQFIRKDWLERFPILSR